jgi:hypothetical protein
MVALDYMPLILVEGKGILNLMSILAPDYKVPSRNTVKFFMSKTDQREIMHSFYKVAILLKWR